MGALSRVLAVVLGGVLFLSLASAAGARTPHVSLKTSYKSVCGKSRPGVMHCDAAVAVGQSGKPIRSAAAFGFSPSDLQSAYGLTAAAATRGGDQTIAIVDAFDSPRAEADLAVYRAHFGLSPCTTRERLLPQGRPERRHELPGSGPGWAQEIALDLDMASAMCPNCKILLVEASSPSATNLATAVHTAASLGATPISNSYGGPEFPVETYVRAVLQPPRRGRDRQQRRRRLRRASTRPRRRT